MMTHPFRLALASLALAAVAFAEDASPATTPASSSAAGTKNILTGNSNSAAPASPAPETAAPKKPRAVSSEVAAILATGMPKYTPPPPPPEAKPAEDTDLRETDKPQNGIVRLPSMVVRGNRVPVFRERDLNTEKGLSKIAMRHYEGLNIPLIGFLNRPVALQMYREEQRLSDIDELRKAASDAKIAGDTADSEYIRRTGAESFVRRGQFGSLGEKR